MSDYDFNDDDAEDTVVVRARPVPPSRVHMLKEAFRIHNGKIIRKGGGGAVTLHSGFGGRRFLYWRVGSKTHQVFADTLKLYLDTGEYDVNPIHIDGKMQNDGIRNLRLNVSAKESKKTSTGVYRNPNPSGPDTQWCARVEETSPTTGHRLRVDIGMYPTEEIARMMVEGVLRYRKARVESLNFSVRRKGRKAEIRRNLEQGYPGVYWHEGNGSWQVISRVQDTGNPKRHLGYFPVDQKEDAYVFYREWLKVHGTDRVREEIRAEEI